MKINYLLYVIILVPVASELEYYAIMIVLRF